MLGLESLGWRCADRRERGLAAVEVLRRLKPDQLKGLPLQLSLGLF